MRQYLSFFVLYLAFLTSLAQTAIATGEQPRLSVDQAGIIRLVYGDKDHIYVASSFNNGATFSEPKLIGEVPGMHLGMTRGPQLATSKDQSLVAAMDKQGNIHAFMLDHRSNKWQKIRNINDVAGSAPEGLMSIAADTKNNFYAVWLDLRNDHKNNICFSAMRNGQWSANKFAYVSPDTHVCECCKPSVAVNNNSVSIMFRNWLKGSRDLYLSVSSDGGNNFTTAQKLGTGTWALSGCPMDGGGLAMDSGNGIETAWQRDGVVFRAQPGKQEQRVAEGRHVALHHDVMTWQQGSDLFISALNGNAIRLADGSAPDAIRLKDRSVVVVWEKEHQIISKIIVAKDLEVSHKDKGL